MKSLAERNRLTNVYRKEARESGQRSPFRQQLYVTARIKGKSPEEALAASRNSTKHNPNECRWRFESEPAVKHCSNCDPNIPQGQQ